MPPTVAIAWADFTPMMDCMPESGLCHSVYSLDFTKGKFTPDPDARNDLMGVMK